MSKKSPLGAHLTKNLRILALWPLLSGRNANFVCPSPSHRGDGSRGEKVFTILTLFAHIAGHTTRLLSPRLLLGNTLKRGVDNMGQYEKWSNIAPFPFGSVVGQLQNMEQYVHSNR